MNNKGQTLVAFVLLMPIIFIFLSLIVDIGRFNTEKRNLDNNIKYAIRYGLNNLNDENLQIKIKNILKDNIDDISVMDINIVDNMISISATKETNGTYSRIIGNQSYKLTSYYEGYIENEKVIINRK